MDAIPLSALVGQHVVIEEKMDGANAGLSFDAEGRIWLQSRGHYLTGGYRERHWDLFKQWASCHADPLRERLGDRYLMYGEWLFAKHTVFYDALPHYFMEFDVFDRVDGVFLSTERRQTLLEGLPVVSVSVLQEGTFGRKDTLAPLVGPSAFKTASWREVLGGVCDARGISEELTRRQTDRFDEMEGLYIKVEADGQVQDRFKFVRASFLQALGSAQGHWIDRPIVPNQLATGVDIFGGTP
jgi:hypothetical protein